MAYTNKEFNWDFDALKRFYDVYVLKWINVAVNWTEAQMKQARANLGFGDGDFATGSDFTNPDTAKRAKIPTVGAILDGLNDGVYDVSARNSGATFASLDDLLSNASLSTLIPTSWRKNGMTIQFKQSPGNEYVQFRYMLPYANTTEGNAAFIDESNWQGVSFDGSDFTNPDTAKRAKIPTVGAILDGLNDGVYDVSKRNPTGGENHDGKFTLEYILNNANTLIPTSWRHGGMLISFVDSSDNKYVQFRCMAQNFTTDVTQWQGVDNEPILGSNNVVKSSGVARQAIKIVGFGTTGANAGVTGKGQVYYNTNDKKLKLCTGYTTVPTAFVDVSYLDGAVYTYNDLLYVWNGTDLVLGSKSVTGEADSTYGNTAIKYGDDRVANVILANKILRIKGIGANAGAISTTTWVVGEYMWSTTTHCIRKCTSVSSAGAATGFADIPSYIGALYSLDNKLYVCVGSDIVRVKQNISITKNNTTGYAKITIDEVEQSIPLATDINIALLDTKVVTLKGIAASAGDISTTDWHVGEYMWSTQLKKLRRCNGVNTSGAATNFYDYNGSINAMYLYNGEIYKYDPSDLSLKVATSNIYAEISKTNNKITVQNIEKIDSASTNLINPQTVTLNKGINGSIISTLTGGFLTDYIPVNGNDIISNALFNATWGGAVYDANFVRIRALSSAQYEYQEGDAFIRLTYGTSTPLSSAQANYGNALMAYTPYNPIDGYTEEIRDNFDNYAKDNISIATGNQKACRTYESELAASPVSNVAPLYISSKTIKKNKSNADKNLNIVAVNHDDLPQSDYDAVVKIYNKFGFRASFCYINNPFSSLSLKKQAVRGISRVINEGHEIGLHAILASSYWLFNKMFDVKPNGESNFAPTVSELKGEQADGTGTNTFGRTITLNTKLTDIGYLEPHTNSKVVELTNEINAENNRFYTFYGDIAAVSGLDLDDITVSKTRLQWLEYWYNNLIDDSIGYSSTESALSDRFSEDYDYPNLYPDAEHILNGKMVHYDDTTNPHYNDADYQKVGKFTQGLFKDSYSTCNYEVMDRAIAAVEAFARKYFGLNHFTDCHRHGVISAAVFWKDSNGLCYCNREKTVVDGGNGTFFHSRFGNFVKQIDIMQMFGIKQIVQDAFRNELALQGQIGFFFGQNGRRNNLLNVVTDADSYGIVGFGSLFGTEDTEGQENMNYTRFHAFIDGINDWTKYFYENADKSMTRGESTEYVFSIFRQCIDVIRSSKGTGKVPFISLDTIRINPSSYTLVDLLCRYCKSNGYRIVPANEALETILSVNRNTGGNLFPNPTFEQSLVDYFGGESDSRDAYIPDGWRNNARDNGVYTVTTETVDSQEMQVLSIAPASTSNVNIYTKMYGLPAGKYRLTYYSKSTDETSIVGVYANKNSNRIYDYGGSVDTYRPTSQWQKHTVDIIINEPYQKVENTGTSNACDGYQDTIIAVRLLISVNSSDVVYFANPKMYAIPEGLN